LSYRVKLSKGAEKELAKLPKTILKRIDAKIEQLKQNPRPRGVKKLRVKEGYRVAVGDYRILYTVDNEAKEIKIYRVRHRGKAYR
jgi:mRNA interferase RelE/StbE